jgi:endonuclease G
MKESLIMKSSAKSSRSRIIFSLLIIQLLTFAQIAFAKVEVLLGTTPLVGNPNLALSPPENSNDEILISRSQYVLSYNKNRRSPNWVAWKLEANQIGSSGRSNSFAIDNELETYLLKDPLNSQVVTPDEFRGSCFDRGHQIPSADRTDSIENNITTFMMSNMIPQTPFLNRVIWEHLEQYTRNLVQKQGKKAYIIAGPIYDQDFGFIGPNKDIPVPSKDFKIIVVLDQNQSPDDIDANTPIISVVMPNTLQDGSKPLTDINQLCNKSLTSGPADKGDWMKYKTTLAEVERLSGFKILTLKNKL